MPGPMLGAGEDPKESKDWPSLARNPQFMNT